MLIACKIVLIICYELKALWWDRNLSATLECARAFYTMMNTGADNMTWKQVLMHRQFWCRMRRWCGQILLPFVLWRHFVGQ